MAKASAKLTLDLEDARSAVVKVLGDALFQYSEWLDSQGLIKPENEISDHRPHDELVDCFLQEKGILERPAAYIAVLDPVQTPLPQNFEERPEDAVRRYCLRIVAAQRIVDIKKRLDGPDTSELRRILHGERDGQLAP